jgi:hypothetical protein
MKGKKVMGKKYCLGEDHDTNLLGQVHEVCIH